MKQAHLSHPLIVQRVFQRMKASPCKSWQFENSSLLRTWHCLPQSEGRSKEQTDAGTT